MTPGARAGIRRGRFDRAPQPITIDLDTGGQTPDRAGTQHQGTDMRLTPMARALALTAALWAVATGAQANTLEDVKERGRLECGVSTGLAGFSEVSDQGTWKGFDVDFCRGIAAAVLGDASKVNFVPLNAQERFTALQSGEIDVLSRFTTWSFSRDTQLGIDFLVVTYYDGQGFVVPRALSVASATELDGARICVESGTTTELNLGDYVRANDLSMESIVIRNQDEARANYLAEACDAYTTDISGLAALRSTLPDPSAHVILPEVISKEPLAVAVRHGDNEWGDVVRWSVYATMIAEEFGVTRETVTALKAETSSPELRRLLGAEGSMGQQLGLDPDWAYRIIAAVGNYGEIFDRNIGRDSTLSLERGLNALWTDGGLHYAPPMR